MLVTLVKKLNHCNSHFIPYNENLFLKTVQEK